MVYFLLKTVSKIEIKCKKPVVLGTQLTKEKITIEF